MYIVFIFLSCSKEKEKSEMLTADISIYYPSNINISKAVDINMDGAYNTNLFMEMPSLKKDPIIIDFEKKSIKIFWQEPRIDNLPLGVLPDQYSESMLLRFYPVRNTYLYRISEDGFIRPFQEIESSLNPTFIFPQKIFTDKRGKLMFSTQQKALTSEGIEYIDIKGVYEKK